jgi:rhodanese-related sulfurtransferase
MFGPRSIAAQIGKLSELKRKAAAFLRPGVGALLRLFLKLRGVPVNTTVREQDVAPRAMANGYIYPCKDHEAARHRDQLAMTAAAASYAGDVSPTDAFDALKADEGAVLVDVRTQAEWAFVGVPDLSGLGKPVGFIEWLAFPGMAPNANFMAELDQVTGGDQTRPVYFLCRSGQRSQSAAAAATAQGYGQAYNIEGGFEGALDGERHRGTVSGWKAAGLPWAQS